MILGSGPNRREFKQGNNGRSTTMMELKLSTDVTNAPGKIASGLMAIGDLPKAEREAMRPRQAG
jgi:hypothetical protein